MPFDFYRFRNIFDPNRMLNADSSDMMPPSPNLSAMGEANGMFQQPRLNPYQQSPMAPSSEMDEASQINAIMKSLYTPEHEFSDRLKGLLDNIPQRNEVSGLRRLGGVLVGIGQGPEAQEKAMYAPYYRQMADFNVKLGPTIKGAELERANNANKRLLAYQTASATTSARQQITREAAERRRTEDMKADNARDAEKNRINAWKAEHPDGEVIAGADGFIHLVNPKTGQDTKTTVEHGKATDLEKANWKMREIGAQIEGRIRVRQTPDARTGNENDPRNWSIQTIYDESDKPIATVRVNKVTGEVKPIPPGSAALDASKPIVTKPGPSATQDAKQTENNIQQWLIQHPEDQKFFKQDENGLWTLIPPSRNALGYNQGPSAERYEQIKRAITGSSYQSNGKNLGKERKTSRGTTVIEVD